MSVIDKIDKILGEADNPLKNVKWFVDQGIANRLMDKKTQVEVIWKAGAKQVKVQFRDMKTSEYIGHTFVPTKGMKSKEFLKHVDSDMKNIWKSKKRGMNEMKAMKVKGWETEADKYEIDYSKELDDGRIIHLVLNDTDFPTDGSAVVTYPEGSKRAKSTSFEVKSEKDIPNVLKKVERWAK